MASTNITLGENGQPLTDTLYLAGEDGLKFLFHFLGNVFGPVLEQAKVEFAKALTDAGEALAHDAEKGVEDIINKEVESTVPALEPVVQSVENTVNKSVDNEIADLEKRLEALKTGN